MKLVRYLKEVNLLKSVNVKQPNGAYIKSYENIGSYKVQEKTLNDEISASIYGANINKMLNLSTALGDLEEYLIPKVDNKEDNISLYFIKIKDKIYKITSVRTGSIVVERL